MRTLQEIQQDFLAIQSEIGATELRKLTLFSKAVKLEAEFLEAQNAEANKEPVTTEETPKSE